MDAVIGFIIVALIGYFIMMCPKLGKGCFRWCDVGKGLLGVGITNILALLIKGGIQPVAIKV